MLRLRKVADVKGEFHSSYFWSESGQETEPCEANSFGRSAFLSGVISLESMCISLGNTFLSIAHLYVNYDLVMELSLKARYYFFYVYNMFFLMSNL